MYFKLQHILWIFVILAVSKASIHVSSIMKLGKFAISEAQKVRLPSFIPEIPEHCRDQGVCSDVPNYPQEYIDQLLQSNSTVSNALSFVRSGYNTPEGCKPSNRDPNDVELCASEIRLILAKAGQDSNGNWRFLVGEHWLCVEICEKAGQPCSHRGIQVFTNYSATCIQKKISQRAVGLDGNGEMKYLQIDVNSACCCQVTQNNHVLQSNQAAYNFTTAKPDTI